MHTYMPCHNIPSLVFWGERGLVDRELMLKGLGSGAHMHECDKLQLWLIFGPFDGMRRKEPARMILGHGNQS